MSISHNIEQKWERTVICRKSIAIHKIFTSPAHNYFTHKRFIVGDAPTYEHKTIKLQSGQGLENDRFEFSKYPITFFSLEVAEEVCKELDIQLDLQLFRRNIIISGIHLTSLVGNRFKIGDVEFEGIAHCAPCTWMNGVMKKGAYSLMKGRGGLRVKVVNGGVLSCGDNTFESQVNLDENPLTPLKIQKIPKLKLH